MATLSAMTPAVAPARLGARRSAGMTGGAVQRRAMVAAPAPLKRDVVEVEAGAKELRDRINSVKNTQKITDAMKLVSAAKVRRAQTAVVNGRPFSQNLVSVLYGLNSRLKMEDVEAPLTTVRPVKKVLLVSVTGDRGLCGGYNNYVLKKVEQRLRELRELGVDFKLMSIGKKGNNYFGRRPATKLYKTFEMGQSPNTKDAQAIADEIYSEFVSEDVDKVELIFTKFVSLISSEPVVQTLLPMTAKGEICDINGKCVDAANDEMFKLTSQEGKLAVEREPVMAANTASSTLDGSLIFEQDPNQILDALLPLYMNSQILRALQEALASELAARMNAMSNASDNAKELKKNLTLKYNRGRQAAITNSIIEVCSGAAA